MSEARQNKLREIIDLGYSFRFGDYFERGIDLYRKYPFGFAGYTAVFFLLLIVLAVIPFVGQLTLLIVLPPLAAGFYLVAYRLDRNESVEFSEFFKGFDFLGQLILVYLVIIVVFALLITPFVLLMVADMLADQPFDLSTELPQFDWYIWLLAIPLAYLSVSWRWAPLFVLFHGLRFWEALEASRRLIQRQWLMVFLFTIVVGIIGNIGYLALLIGLLFTYPMSICIDYAAFADVTRLSASDQEADDISDHLVA